MNVSNCIDKGRLHRQRIVGWVVVTDGLPVHPSIHRPQTVQYRLFTHLPAWLLGRLLLNDDGRRMMTTTTSTPTPPTTTALN